MGQWKRQKTIGERLKNNQQIIFNGDVGGRLRTFPIGGDGNGHGFGDREDFGDGGPEVAFYNQTFLVTATGDQNLNLTYEPFRYSEHLYWCPASGAGIYLEEGEDWQRTSTSSMVVNGGLLQVGDQLVVEYAYDPNSDSASS